MKEILLALGTGVATGCVFAVLKMPIPAPLAFSGVAGVIGIWLGYSVVAYLVFGRMP